MCGVSPTLAVLWALLRGGSNTLSFARRSRKQLYTRAENVTSFYYAVSIRQSEHRLGLGSGFSRSSRSPQLSATPSPEGGVPM